MPPAAETALPRSDRHAEPAAAGATAFSRWQWACLILATAVAAALRFADLGTWSFWIDEAHTWRDATMPLGTFVREDRVLYPLTFLALRGLLGFGLVGNDEYSLRLPFALLGVLTVPVLALCGRRLVGPGAAVLAAWFLAVHPWHVYWSQNARGYVLTFLFAAVACNRAHAYAVTLRTRDMIVAMAAIGTSALSHPTGVMLAVGLFVFLWLRRVQRLHRRVVLWLVLCTVLVGVLLPPAVEVVAPWQDFLRAKGSGASLLHFLQTSVFYFRPLLLFAAGVGLAIGWRWLGRERALLLGCLAGVPFYVLLTVGYDLVKVTARYAICTLPVLTWLAALACTRLAAFGRSAGRRQRGPVVAVAAALPLLLVLDSVQQLADYYTVQHGQRARWREACAFAQRHAGTAPLRVLTVNQPTVTYYLHPGHWQLGPGDNPLVQVEALLDWRAAGTEGDMRLHEPGAANHLRWHAAQARRGGARFVVMVTRPELAEIDQRLPPEPDAGREPFRRALERDYELALHLPCWVGPKDEGVYVYVPRPD